MDAAACAMGRQAGIMEGRGGTTNRQAGRAVPAAPGKVTVAVVLLCPLLP